MTDLLRALPVKCLLCGALVDPYRPSAGHRVELIETLGADRAEAIVVVCRGNIQTLICPWCQAAVPSHDPGPEHEVEGSFGCITPGATAPARINWRVTRCSATPRTIWYGTFTLGGIVLKCYTLSDGQRVVDADDLNRLVDALASDRPMPANDPAELKRFTVWRRGGIQ